jgi:short-subunit dehydrogenase
VLITGAAGGIGEQIALLYAKKGFSLILVDINPVVEDVASELAKKYKAQTFRHMVCNLADRDSAEKIFRTVTVDWELKDQIMILVNNAGFGETQEFVNSKLERLQAMMDVNMMASVQLAHHFGRLFVSRNQGRITQIASIAAYTPGVHAAVYHGTKSFVRNWCVAFDFELKGTGVGVTIVSPAAVRTNFMDASQCSRSMMFTALSGLNYTPQQVAEAAVEGTLKGKKEIVVGPLVDTMQWVTWYLDDTFKIMGGKFLWADPGRKCRPSYQFFSMAEGNKKSK